jgi:hypothetical protein
MRRKIRFFSYRNRKKTKSLVATELQAAAEQRSALQSLVEMRIMEIRALRAALRVGRGKK